MKDIAVVICNYNKKEYVIKCIESLQKQIVRNFDIYVVDNASSDGSVGEIQRTYGDAVTLLCNTENLGGSGGFNTGMRVAYDSGYKYIVLLDNDVVLDKNALRIMCEDMKNNPHIGIMGAKILKMDYPDIIQEFAPTVNYSTMTFELNHGGEKDTGELPHFVDCDYVPACALIVKCEVIEKIGYMSEENFIYYDDIEWGVRCHRAGYRVVANSKATVWHKGGARVNPTTFGTYYLNRNKLRFFMTYMQTDTPKYVEKEKIDTRVENILNDIYEGIYSCEYHGMLNVAKTRMDAFLDALNMISGKAMPLEIRAREDMDDKFDKEIIQAESIRIYMNGYFENTRRILNYIHILEEETGVKKRIEIIGDGKNSNYELLGIQIKQDIDKPNEDYDLVLYVCKHIYELELDSVDRKWIDGWRNIIFDDSDFENYKGYMHSYHVFKIAFEDRVREVMKKLNGDYSYDV